MSIFILPWIFFRPRDRAGRLVVACLQFCCVFWYAWPNAMCVIVPCRYETGFFERPSVTIFGVAPGMRLFDSYLGTARVVKGMGDPRLGFGQEDIPSVTISFFNYQDGHETLIGPDSAHPDLEFTIHGELLTCCLGVLFFFCI